MDNLYLNKQYKEVIEHAISHFHLPLTTNEILQSKRKKRGDGGLGRRLGEVYDVLVWCYFNLGSWEMAEQILLALVWHYCFMTLSLFLRWKQVEVQPHNFIYWRVLGKCQSNLGKYEGTLYSLSLSLSSEFNLYYRCVCILFQKYKAKCELYWCLAGHLF